MAAGRNTTRMPIHGVRKGSAVSTLHVRTLHGGEYATCTYATRRRNRHLNRNFSPKAVTFARKSCMRVHGTCMCAIASLCLALCLHLTLPARCCRSDATAFPAACQLQGFRGSRWCVRSRGNMAAQQRQPQQKHVGHAPACHQPHWAHSQPHTCQPRPRQPHAHSRQPYTCRGLPHARHAHAAALSVAAAAAAAAVLAVTRRAWQRASPWRPTRLGRAAERGARGGQRHHRREPPSEPLWPTH